MSASAKDSQGSVARARWDPLILALRDQRERVGGPSYAQIAERIQRDRMQRGAPEYTARIARSTVYDAFRLERSRVNLPLLREIGRALGAAEDTVEAWIEACHTPLLNTPSSSSPPAPVTPPVSTPASTHASLHATLQGAGPGSAPRETEPGSGPRTKQTLVLMLACLAINLAGRQFVDAFQLPLYLDMVGTAIAAIALGPWRGAAVGATTNVLGALGSGMISLPFALVNVLGALLWGYGVRRWRMDRSIVHFFGLNVITAWACSALAIPIIVLSQQRDLRVGGDVVTQLMGDSFDAFVVAVSFSNLLTSTADKLLSGFIALVAISALPAALHSQFRLAALVRHTGTR